VNKRELELWVDQEHGPATFVFNDALAPTSSPTAPRTPSSRRSHVYGAPPPPI
jgi:hypothetical protein